MQRAYWSNGRAWLYQGHDLDVLRQIPDGVIQAVVTSPPYFGLRDYGCEGQRGAEASPAEYVAGLVELYREVRRVLRPDGVFWLNIGDSYSTYPGNRGTSSTGFSRNDPLPRMPKGAGLSGDRPNKSLLMIPARTALALQDDGWLLRNDIVWHKTNPMPFSGKDRLTCTYEHVLMLTKSGRYYFDLDAIRVPHAMRPQRRPRGRPKDSTPRPRAQQSWSTQARDEPAPDGHPLGKNPGDVWSIPTRPFKEAHFATFPPELPETCILASTRPGDIVLDPASGSGTTGMVALRHGRRYVGIELNTDYLDLSIRTRFADGNQHA